jgi:hypothetical protein
MPGFAALHFINNQLETEIITPAIELLNSVVFADDGAIAA